MYLSHFIDEETKAQSVISMLPYYEMTSYYATAAETHSQIQNLKSNFQSGAFPLHQSYPHPYSVTWNKSEFQSPPFVGGNSTCPL